MKRLLTTLATLLIVPFCTQAFILETDTNVTIDTVQEDAVAAIGSTVHVRSIIDGDAFLVWENITLTWDIYEDAWIAWSAVIIEGEVQDDLRAVWESISISGPILGDVLLWWSELTIDSEISGDVQLFAERITFWPNASIAWDLTLPEQFLNDDVTAIVSGTVTWREPMADTTNANHDWFWWFGLLTKIVTSALLILLCGRFLAPIGKTVIDRPGQSLLAWFAYFGWMPILALVLLMTWVLAPIAGLVIVDYLFAWIFLSVMVAVVVAAYLIRTQFTDNPQLQTRRWTTLVAWVILTILQVLPYIVTWILWVFVVGALILYLRSMRTYFRSDSE